MKARRLMELVVLVTLHPACGNTTLDVFDPDRGLVAHWALDETQSGATVLDSSGQGNSGTPSQPPPLPSTSVPPVHFSDPRSLAFDGETELVQFANPDDLDISGPITLCAWVNILATDGSRYVIAHGYESSPDAEIALRIDAGTYEMSSWNGNDHQTKVAIPPGDIGAWVHLCGVYDGGAYLVYDNGALLGSTADSTGPPQVGAPWSIGAHAASGSSGNERFFSGSMDDVRVYARALTAAEIMALYDR